ncbi:hypothetical protein Mp_2g25800 [Marchantia polymorpha subsp. ruderalis]|uniref:Uncharacterized protein n=1 Tax=Marchantia polymorpha TaxID=3197 RepID=A0A2R6XBC1_MARPO|nr:hypothetical protein MARPO_0025s0098 [Marchantia polymorpha]BBN03718.1 hypothetical protein Mp_2g25800 [Marchantia polymorpha subsp. ruderalis]|eukprot:PTQ43414.1 hypothetical protein MARPO_0025s0098 [Marchantia polymorpha]
MDVPCCASSDISRMRATPFFHCHCSLCFADQTCVTGVSFSCWEGYTYSHEQICRRFRDPLLSLWAD